MTRAAGRLIMCRRSAITPTTSPTSRWGSPPTSPVLPSIPTALPPLSISSSRVWLQRWKPTLHCDLEAGWPGTGATDVEHTEGFAAQLGFRLPNMVISPFTRRHYVSHIPLDHTAVLKFVESRFIGPTAHLTNRDAAQPDLLDFFDFTNVPWSTPPTPPTPTPDTGATCHPGTLGTAQ